MKRSVIKYLVCPKCKTSLHFSIRKGNENEVYDGELKCLNRQCASTFPITDGFADLCVLKHHEERDVVDSFGFEWDVHYKGELEKDAVFGRDSAADLEYFFTALHMRPEDLMGKLVLDAGCGSAKLTKMISELSPNFVFGTDINTATAQSAKYCRGTPNCEILRADIFSFPFPPGTFDIVWCNGVIHHTPEPYKAFECLSRMVKPEGILYVWVYEDRFSPFNQLKDIFRLLRLDKMRYSYLFNVCKFLSITSVALHKAYRLVFYLPTQLGLLKSNRLLGTLRYRSYREFLMTWFDSLSPRFDSRHTRKEVTEWFMHNGFGNLEYYNDQIGVRGIKGM